MKLSKILRDQSGTTALEFALTAPVFFLFIFGVIEVGLLFWTQIGMQHGAEMAARCASINAALCPTSNPNAIIGIHDFASRPKYHCVREIAREIATAGDMSFFRPLPEKKIAEAILQSFHEEPY